MYSFLLGVFISRLGDAFSFLAMILILTKRGAGSGLVSCFMIAHYLPGVFVGIWGRTWFDRIRKKRALVLVYLASAGLTAGAAFFTSSPFVLLVFSALLGVMYGIYVPLQKAFIAEVVLPENTRRANSLVQVAETLAKTAGFALAGLVFHQAGPKFSFLLDALSFVSISGLIAVTRSVSNRPRIFTAASASLDNSTFDLLSMAFALTWLGTGTLFALEANYAQTYLHASETTIGWLFSFATLGALFVPYLLARWKPKSDIQPILYACLSEMIFVAAYSLSLNLTSAVLWITLYGCVLTARQIFLSSWIHEQIPAHLHGSAFALQQGRANFMMMIGMGISGYAAEAFGTRLVILGATLLGMVGVVLLLGRFVRVTVYPMYCGVDHD